MDPIANSNLEFLITTSDPQSHQRKQMNKFPGKIYLQTMMFLMKS